MENYTSTVILINSTISGNSAALDGGGLYDLYSAVTLARALISGNTASRGSEVYHYGGTATVDDFNLFGFSGNSGLAGITPGASDTVATVALGAILNPTLADKSGPTRTHALVSGSPAVDAVGSGCPPPNTDQRGIARPQGSTCDIGAFELGPPQPGVLQINSQTFSVPEDGGTATISVTRTGGSDGPVSVSYLTAAGGTATEGADYTFSQGVLTWADGDTANKSFQVPIIDDADPEDGETVNLALSNPDGGATLGTPSTAVLTIPANDQPVGSCQGVAATKVGTSGNDTLNGTSGADVISGLGAMTSSMV
jgi:hypothetical protein